MIKLFEYNCSVYPSFRTQRSGDTESRKISEALDSGLRRNDGKEGRCRKDEKVGLQKQPEHRKIAKTVNSKESSIFLKSLI
jgi:hypothetical protein